MAASSSQAIGSVDRRLPLRAKLAYGVGEVARASILNIRVFFLLYFLTEVAGLNAGLAGTILLLGRLWDAVNDPLVGWMSDRTQSNWGRRYPWMLWGAIPLGLFCWLQWIVPSFSPSGLFWYYVIISLLFDTALTAVAVPHSTLAAELTDDYHDRTHLISIQMAFSVTAGIAILIVAQGIFGAIDSPTLRYSTLGLVCAILAILVIYLCVWGTRPFTHRSPAPLPPRSPAPTSNSALWPQIKAALQHREFLLVTGMYVFSWISVQTTAAILPYFVHNWMGLPDSHMTQMAIAIQLTAFVMLLVWRRISQRIGKKAVFLWGIPLLMVGQCSLSLLPADQVGWMYGAGIVIGIGLALVYLVPWAMLPDVIDQYELDHGQRGEGIFYGVMLQMQKLGLAIALFLASQGLNWAGLIPATEGESAPQQPAMVLTMIRLEIGVLPAIVVAISLIMAMLYPISRDRHAEIQLKLAERKSNELADT